MSNVIYLNPNICIHEALRAIADSIESGEVLAENATLCMLSDTVQVYQLGTISDYDAGREAVFNMTMGIAQITSQVMGELVSGDD